MRSSGAARAQVQNSAEKDKSQKVCDGVLTLWHRRILCPCPCPCSCPCRLCTDYGVGWDVANCISFAQVAVGPHCFTSPSRQRVVTGTIASLRLCLLRLLYPVEIAYDSVRSTVMYSTEVPGSLYTNVGAPRWWKLSVLSCPPQDKTRQKQGKTVLVKGKLVFPTLQTEGPVNQTASQFQIPSMMTIAKKQNKKNKTIPARCSMMCACNDGRWCAGLVPIHPTDFNTRRASRWLPPRERVLARYSVD